MKRNESAYRNMVPAGENSRPFTVMLVEDETGLDCLVHVRARNSSIAITKARKELQVDWRAPMVFNGHVIAINGEPRK